MGLAPMAARVGDLVIRFWNCDAAIVVRTTTLVDSDSGAMYGLVGRADVAEPYDRQDGSDNQAREAMEMKPFSEPHTKGMYVSMNFDTLQQISAVIEI